MVISSQEGRTPSRWTTLTATRRRKGLRRSLREQHVEWVLEGPAGASGAWDGLSSGKSSVHPSRRVTGFVTAPAAAQIRFPFASAPAFFASLGGLHRRNPTTRPARQEGAQKPISGLFTLACWFISSDRKRALNASGFFGYPSTCFGRVKYPSFSCRDSGEFGAGGALI